MKLKKLFLSFLVAHSALFPFVVTFKTKAVNPMAKFLGSIAALSTTAMFTYMSNNNAVVTPKPIIQEITKTVVPPITKATINPSFFSFDRAKNTALAIEQLGLKGLEKLSFSINPASIYQFFRKHHEMTAILAFLGVCGAWYSSKQISAWNADQSQLRQEVLDSLQNNFVQFSQIIETKKKPSSPYVVLPTNVTTLVSAQKIVTLPFLKKDQKSYNLLKEFYTKCSEIISEANSNTKPDTHSATYMSAVEISNQIKKRLLSLL